MGLLDTIKSFLGIGGSTPERSNETTVSVEREPDAESETAVKGEVDEPVATSTDATGSTESIVEEEEAGQDPAEAAEPAEAAGPDLEDKATDIADDGAESEGAEAGTSVEEIKGIGPAYGERLAESGIETVAELAAADPDELAERTSLPGSRLADWVERARDYEE